MITKFNGKITNYANKTFQIVVLFINTGEELLHEGWSSYGNFSGVLMITVENKQN
jgi:hypothetical protein